MTEENLLLTNIEVDDAYAKLGSTVADFYSSKPYDFDEIMDSLRIYINACIRQALTEKELYGYVIVRD